MVSSKDVAKYAGVSQTTVSRVLNTPNLVKPKTVQKVLKAIDELHYIPNSQARSLVQNKTNTIALLSGPLHNPFFVDSTSNIVQYANQKGYNVDVQFVSDETLDEAYTNFLKRKVDGVILSCILIDDPFMEKLKKIGIPFITFNRKHRDNELYVEIDNEQASFLATTYLQKLNHKEIIYVGGPLSVSTFYNRFEGFKKALTITDKNLIYHSDTTPKDVRKGIDILLKRNPRVTGIVAATDSIALIILDYLLELGIQVPKEISIIGIDNVEQAKHQSIQLTTVGDAHGENLGLLAIKKLIALIEGETNVQTEVTKSVCIYERKTTMRC